MGVETNIEWCDHTFNGWRGCAVPGRIGDSGDGPAPECVHCYARANATRNPSVFGTWGSRGLRVVAAESTWRQPLAWAGKARAEGVRRRVFAFSLADVFEDRPDLIAPRARLFALIDATPELDWLLLTKRPESIRRLWVGGPRRNVWLGTSCGHPASLWRVDALRKCGDLAALLFVSAEPLLADVDFSGRLGGIGWLIVGGESGPKARPFDLMWARRTIADCRAAAVPVFVKQLGRRPDAGEWWDESMVPHRRILIRNPKGGDPSEWPPDVRVREFPTAVAAVEA